MNTTLRQVVAITLMNLASLPMRRDACAVVLIGMAAVAFVFVALFAMGNGLQSAIARTGQPDRVLLLGAGSNSEINGSITREQAAIVAGLPGIAATVVQHGPAPRRARPQVSPEIYATANLARADGAGLSGLAMRGVGEDAWRVRPEVRIVAGRRPQPGRFEMLVGRGARQVFAGLDIGDVVAIKGARLRVVGEFEAGGSATESEVWLDLDVMANVFRRGAFLNSITVRLASADGFDAFTRAVAGERRLRLAVFRESAFYRAQAASSARMVSMVGIVAGTLMAFGALFSALNVQFASVAARTREIATLKALGFGGSAVVMSVLVESLLLSALGGVMGAAMGAWIFDGWRMSSFGGAFAELAFAFTVTPRLLAAALLLTMLLGLVGGALPALRAARQEVVRGLRAVA